MEALDPEKHRKGKCKHPKADEIKKIIDSYHGKNWRKFKKNILKKLFKDFYRLMDDLFVMGMTDVEFQKHACLMYPDFLVLKRESVVTDKEVNFTDLCVTACNHGREVTFKMYDKRWDFNFRAVRFVHGLTCISDTTKLAIQKGQILRVHQTNFGITDVRDNMVKLQAQFMGREHDPFYSQKKLRIRSMMDGAQQQ